MSEFSYDKHTRKSRAPKELYTLDLSILKKLEEDNDAFLKGFEHFMKALQTLEATEVERPPPPETALAHEVRAEEAAPVEDMDEVILEVIDNLVAGANPFPDDHRQAALRLLIDVHTEETEKHVAQARQVAYSATVQSRIVQPLLETHGEEHAGDKIFTLKNISITVLSAGTALLSGYLLFPYLQAAEMAGMVVDISYRVFIVIRSVRSATTVEEGIEIFLKTGARNVIEFSVGIGLRQGLGKYISTANPVLYIGSQVLIRMLQNGVQVILQNPRFLGLTAVERELQAREEAQRTLRVERENLERAERYIRQGPSRWDRFRDATYERYEKIITVADNHPYITSTLAILGSSVIATRLMNMLPEQIDKQTVGNDHVRFFINIFIGKQALETRIVRGKLLPFICEHLEKTVALQRRVIEFVNKRLINLDRRDVLDIDRLLKRDFTMKILSKNILAQIISATAAVITEETLLTAINVDYISLAQTDFSKAVTDFMAGHKMLDIDAVKGIYAKLVDHEFTAGSSIIDSMTNAARTLKTVFNVNRFLGIRDIENVQPAGPAENVQPAGPAENVQPAGPAENVASRQIEEEARRASEGARKINGKIDSYEAAAADINTLASNLVAAKKEAEDAIVKIQEILNSYRDVLNPDVAEALSQQHYNLSEYLDDVNARIRNIPALGQNVQDSLDELHHALFNSMWDVNVPEAANIPKFISRPPVSPDIKHLTEELNEKLGTVESLYREADIAGIGDLARSIDIRKLSTAEIDNIAEHMKLYTRFINGKKDYDAAKTYFAELGGTAGPAGAYSKKVISLVNKNWTDRDLQKVNTAFNKFFENLSKDINAAKSARAKDLKLQIDSLLRDIDGALNKFGEWRREVEQMLADTAYKRSLLNGLEISAEDKAVFERTLQDEGVSRDNARDMVDKYKLLTSGKKDIQKSMLGIDKDIKDASILRSMVATGDKSTAGNANEILERLRRAKDATKAIVDNIDKNISDLIRGETTADVNVDAIKTDILTQIDNLADARQRLFLAQRAFIASRRAGPSAEDTVLSGEEQADLNRAQIVHTARLTNIIDNLSGFSTEELNRLVPGLGVHVENAKAIKTKNILETDVAINLFTAYHELLQTVPDDMRNPTRAIFETAADSELHTALKMTALGEMRRTLQNTVTRGVVSQLPGVGLVRGIIQGGEAIYHAKTAPTLETGTRLAEAVASAGGFTMLGSVAGKLGTVAGLATDASVQAGAGVVRAVFGEHAEKVAGVASFLNMGDNEISRLIEDSAFKGMRTQVESDTARREFDAAGLLLRAALDRGTREGIYGAMRGIKESALSTKAFIDRASGREGYFSKVANAYDAASTAFSIGRATLNTMNDVNIAALREPSMLNVLFGDRFRRPVSGSLSDIAFNRFAEAVMDIPRAYNTDPEVYNIWLRENARNIVTAHRQGTLHETYMQYLDEALIIAEREF